MKKIWNQPKLEKLSIQKITLSGNGSSPENANNTGTSFRSPTGQG